MTYNEFIDAAIANQQLHPEWRWGQCLFNTLWEVNPGLANNLRTNADPFYVNHKIPEFLAHVMSYAEAFGSVVDVRV